ncbi:MAG: HIT domain-containing protein [Pseudolabrys sp.]|nr:HIT domain-containing protein [Pseudolabrys sp.]
MTDTNGWTLHPQMEADSAPIGDLPLCRVLAMNDANYPWLVLVPRRNGMRDVIDLTDTDQARLAVESAQAARALKDMTHCTKLNVAALGNTVPQLHVHVIARFSNDAAWPRPVWGVLPAKPYSDVALADFIGKMKRSMALG